MGRVSRVGRDGLDHIRIHGVNGCNSSTHPWSYYAIAIFREKIGTRVETRERLFSLTQARLIAPFLQFHAPGLLYTRKMRLDAVGSGPNVAYVLSQHSARSRETTTNLQNTSGPQPNASSESMVDKLNYAACDEYVCEKILKRRTVRDEKQVLVRWRPGLTRFGPKSGFWAEVEVISLQ
jgi:hypothetical protein